MHLKDQISQISQDLEDKEGILDEIRGERKILQSELHRYITMVKQIQKDFELVSFKKKKSVRTLQTKC